MIGHNFVIEENNKRLKDRGFTVNLKFCAMHTFFNVCGHFRAVAPAIDSIRALFFRLQASSSSLNMMKFWRKSMNDPRYHVQYMLATRHRDSLWSTICGRYIQLGIYLVGGCPLQLLDLRENAIAYQLDNPSIIREYSF
ncbi:Hypothetical protein PHPALM_15579 [Phytophthora palmivora]|uniref:Uncharacterized protein n=1 Tax=Phytophthora palmivora TaxID=4796 RepID=A0A2P4XRU1_9STRA|nr:Hypothetical protein PHPALM_15579 [Phytophthora palmivora]